MPAMAATTPDTSRTVNLIRRVLTPVNSAAVRLPPVASTCRPYLVLASTTAPTTTKAADQSSSPGIGPMLPEPKTMLYAWLRIGCGAEAVIHWATPAAMPSMPRVTRNDGIPSVLTRPPLMAPTTSPTARPATMPATRPHRDRAIAVQTLDRPATEPTLRSISAAAMTYVIATAITVMIAVCRNMLSRLLALRKPWLPSNTAKKRKTTTKPM